MAGRHRRHSRLYHPFSLSHRQEKARQIVSGPHTEDPSLDPEHVSFYSWGSSEPIVKRRVDDWPSAEVPGRLDVQVHLSPKGNPLVSYSRRINRENYPYEINMLDVQEQVYPVEVRVTSVRPQDALRSLDNVLKDAAAHATSHPKHGHNCTCMDEYIREVKFLLRSIAPDKGTQAARRVAWVLMAAVRNY